MDLRKGIISLAECLAKTLSLMEPLTAKMVFLNDGNKWIHLHDHQNLNVTRLHNQQTLVYTLQSIYWITVRV